MASDQREVDEFKEWCKGPFSIRPYARITLQRELVQGDDFLVNAIRNLFLADADPYRRAAAFGQYAPEQRSKEALSAEMYCFLNCGDQKGLITDGVVRAKLDIAIAKVSKREKEIPFGVLVDAFLARYEELPHWFIQEADKEWGLVH